MSILRGWRGLVAEEGAEGAAEAVADAGVGAVVGAFGGGVMFGDEAEGAGAVAVMEGVGPVEVACAEDGEIEGPLGAVDDVGDEGLEVGVREGLGVVAGEGGGVGLPLGGHGVEGGVVAPAVGAGGAGLSGSGLHGST
jgi:hypothetical protein